jgi:tetrahydromethanopterin S-methyltransferase subunit G
MAEKVPIVIVDPEDYKNILQKKLGRDIGILYGICASLMIVVVYLLLLLSPALSNPLLIDAVKKALGLE